MGQDRTALEKWGFRALAACCIGVSLAAIPWAVYCRHIATDGQRGGALGTAISFLFLFINQDRGTRFYDSVTTTQAAIAKNLYRMRRRANASVSLIPATASSSQDGDGVLEQREASLADLVKQIEAFARQLRSTSTAQNRQNKYIALAGFVSALFWGFGDWPAQFWMKQLMASQESKTMPQLVAVRVCDDVRNTFSEIFSNLRPPDICRDDQYRPD